MTGTTIPCPCCGGNLQIDRYEEDSEMFCPACERRWPLDKKFLKSLKELTSFIDYDEGWVKNLNICRINLFILLLMAMNKKGSILMGTGSASGKNRAKKAINEAIKNTVPGGLSLNNAKFIIYAIICKDMVNHKESEEIEKIIYDNASNGFNYYYPQVFDDVYFDEEQEDELKICLILTGVVPGTKTTIPCPQCGGNLNIDRHDDKAEMICGECEKYWTLDEDFANSIPGISGIISKTGGRQLGMGYDYFYHDMMEKGLILLGHGRASGENRVQQATHEAIENTLIDGVSLRNAKSVMYYARSTDVSLEEMKKINGILYEARCLEDEESVFLPASIGIGKDESLGDELVISIMATGVVPGIKTIVPCPDCEQGLFMYRQYPSAKEKFVCRDCSKHWGLVEL